MKRKSHETVRPQIPNREKGEHLQVPEVMKYIIKYRIGKPGIVGDGTTLFTETEADTQVERLNREYPGIRHWKEAKKEAQCSSES